MVKSKVKAIILIIAGLLVAAFGGYTMTKGFDIGNLLIVVLGLGFAAFHYFMSFRNSEDSYDEDEDEDDDY